MCQVLTAKDFLISITRADMGVVLLVGSSSLHHV